MAADTFDQFMERYNPDGNRLVKTFDVPDQSDGPSMFIVLNYRCEDGSIKQVVINPMGMKDHLCIDIHPFDDGKDARAGVFGMEDGYRYDMGNQTPGTSHGWPATKLVAVLVGKQESR